MNEDIQPQTVLSEKHDNSQVHNNNKRFEKTIKAEIKTEVSPTKDIQIIQDPTPASRKKSSSKRKRKEMGSNKTKTKKNVKTEPKVKKESEKRRVIKRREKFIPPPILTEPVEKFVGICLSDMIPRLTKQETRLKVKNIGEIYQDSRNLSWMPGEGL